MKIYKRWLSIILILSVPISVGCKKDDDNGGAVTSKKNDTAAVEEPARDYPDEWVVSESPANDGRLVWAARCPGEGIGNITSGNGIICVQRYLWNDGRTEITYYLDALDGKTGELIWRDEWDDDEWDAYGGSPTIGDGKTFVVKETAVHCIDAATGDRLWDFETPQTENKAGYIDPVFFDGKVYFGNHRAIEDYVYCLDAETGELVWKDGLGPRIHNIGGVNAAYGRIYVSGEEDIGGMWPKKHIYCLDPKTGAHISRDSVSYFTSGKYPPGDYYYYFNLDQSGGGEIVRFDRATGREVNRFGTAYNFLHATAERVYVGSKLGGGDPFLLLCFDGANGDVLWEYNLGEFDSYKGNTIYFDGDEIYTGFDIEGKAGLYCLDAESGEELWVYETSDVINYGDICIEGGFVYVATDDGNLYCLRKD